MTGLAGKPSSDTTGEKGAFRPIVTPDGPVHRPRAVLFDWDNTLVDTWPVIHASLNETFAAMDHPPWTLDQVRANVRKSLRDSFPLLFGDRWEAARDVFYAAFARQHLAALAPLPGATALLEALRGAGIPLGVVSNKTGDFLRKEVTHLGWEAHFGALVGAGDAIRDKPAPEAGHLALEGLALDQRADSAEIWFVGDSNVDMEIAHALGLVPVLVHPDGGPAGEFDAHPPRVHVADCAGLRALALAG